MKPFDVDDAVARYRDGATFRDLGALYGVNEKTVRTRVRAHASYAPRPRGSRPILDPARVLELHLEGLPMRAIAAELGASHEAVRTAFDTLGIERHTTVAAARARLTEEESGELTSLWSRVPLAATGSPDPHSAAWAAFWDRVEELSARGISDHAMSLAIGRARNQLLQWRQLFHLPRAARVAPSRRSEKPAQLVPVVQWQVRCNLCGHRKPDLWADEGDANRALRLFERTHDCALEREIDDAVLAMITAGRSDTDILRATDVSHERIRALRDGGDAE